MMKPEMKALITLCIVLLWCISYWLVIKYTNKFLNEKNFPINIEDYAPAHGKMMMFLVAPLMAMRLLWVELKWKIIEFYVCLPYFGKKNDYTTEDIEKMVDEYLNNKTK